MVLRLLWIGSYCVGGDREETPIIESNEYRVNRDCMHDCIVQDDAEAKPIEEDNRLKHSNLSYSSASTTSSHQVLSLERMF